MADDGTTAVVEQTEAVSAGDASQDEGTTSAASPAKTASPAPAQQQVSDDAAFKAEFDKLAEPSAGESKDKPVDLDSILSEVTGGKAKPGEKKADEPAPKFGERAATKDDGEQEPDESEARDGREKIVLAKRALGRSGQWTAEEIDAMPEDRLIERGQKAHASWEATERYKKDMNKWKAKANGQSPAASDPTDDSPGRSGTEDGSAATDAAEQLPDGFGQLAQKVAEYDPDLRKQIEKVAARDRQAIVKEATVAVETAQRALVHQRLDYAKDKLAEEFPGLKDPAKFGIVRKKLNGWDPDGSAVLAENPGEFYALMRDACEVVFGREMRRQTHSERVASSAKSRNGQPDTSTARQVPAALTEDQKFQVASRLTIQHNGNQARVDADLAKLGITF